MEILAGAGIGSPVHGRYLPDAAPPARPTDHRPRLLSNGTNLLIFAAGGLTRAHPPVVPGARSSWSRPMRIRCRRRWS